MSKIKTFFTDSQPGCVLKISVNLSLNVLIKNILMKKKRVQSETRTRNYFIDINCTNLLNKPQSVSSCSLVTHHQERNGKVMVVARGLKVQ